ncbi:hypothetical protein T484DRAFT_1756824 [Baffinella frigidus]|nr:hypothetical protein T484DRAFT_1756824 [Cryptophyta sp. CCMP2293]
MRRNIQPGIKIDILRRHVLEVFAVAYERAADATGEPHYAHDCLPMLREQIALYGKYEFFNLQVESICTLGRLLSMTLENKYDEQVIACYQQARDVWTAHRSAFAEFMTSVALGQIAHAQGRHADAINLLRAAVAASKVGNGKESFAKMATREMDASSILIEVLLETGAYDEAEALALRFPSPRKLLSTKRKQDDVVADSATALHPFFTKQIRTSATAPLHPFFTKQIRTSAVVAPEQPDDIATVDTTTMETTPTSEPLEIHEVQPKAPAAVEPSLDDGVTVDTTTLETTLDKVPEKKHKCPYDGCDASRRRPGELQEHVDFIHEKIYHNCTGCMETFKDKFVLDRHWVAKHSPKDHFARTEWKCTECNEGFPTSSQCNAHRLRKCVPEDDPKRRAFLDQNNKAQNARYAKNEMVRIEKALRGALRRMMNNMGMGKVSLSDEVMGCIYEELIAHLNDNDRGFVYGKGDVVFHIDHIRPMASFKNLKCHVEVLKCMNFNNLQLLPGPENCSKGDTFTPADEAAYAISEGGLALAELEKGWRADGVCKCELCIT